MKYQWTGETVYPVFQIDLIMEFFQNTVINKYLKALDKHALTEAYARFRKHFHDPAIQENIRNSKEEQYQEGFLNNLFVNVLGYTLNPSENYNLTTEHKNIKDSKKADGAILLRKKDNTPQVIGVIELKSTNTTDLSKVEDQAFGYKNNQQGCVYIITSNFEKLRFYIDNAIEHIEFNLFTLTEKEFELLYLCLAWENIERGIPRKIKEESISQEDIITKKLYNDYSLFKRELHQNLVLLNPQYDPLTLFKKSQKLLDRFLFLFFAEDRQLLPPNSVRIVLNDWRKLQELDEDVPLYNRFKKYFEYLNLGFKGKKYDVFAYNGGLFKPDEILDHLKIDCELLYKHTAKLSDYDFASEVDVNILGHIFENSLNELDEIKAQLEGQEIDKSKTKRKKDGVFYTPKYITKYIVDNTVGKLCTEKKAELEIIEDDYTTNKKRPKKATLSLSEKLTGYRNWLLQLTICDPACGSGAFLNQALNFLIAEHRYIDELHAKLFGDALVMSDIEKSILENNLFGVDLNEESVEIAKLSLWLRTAQPNRKLNDLNNNIKCGNSLIDDPAVAGDKAFNWQNEFPQIFEKGGFDIIIGNPPYLRVQGLRENLEKESIYFESHFESATGRFDIYVLFIEKAFGLLNSKGILSFILPHKFINSDFGKGIRDFLFQNKALNQIVHFGSEMVFNDASTYTCILGLSHNNSLFKFKQINPFEISVPFKFDILNYNLLEDTTRWAIQSNNANLILQKLKNQPQSLNDIFKFISQGIVSVGDEIYLVKGKIVGDKFIGYSEKSKTEIIIESEIVKPILKGEDVKKYQPVFNNYFVIYPHYENDGKTVPYEETIFKSRFPLAYDYFLPYKDELIEKKIRYKTNPTCWYSLHRSREMSLFEQIKIITPEISLGTNMTLDEENFYHNTKCYSLILREEYQKYYKVILAILNSSILWYFLLNTGYVLRGGFFTFKTKYLEPFPIPELKSISSYKFIENADKMLSLNKILQENSQKFQRTIQRKFDLDELPGRLQNWYLLTYAEFITELGKKKIKLSLSNEAEWESYFLHESKIALDLKSKIEATDKEIDQMVYALYELTDEEIKIVEG